MINQSSFMDKKVCIIQHADPNNNNIKVPNTSDYFNGTVHEKLVTTIAKQNGVSYVPAESENTSSVIQQTKNIRTNAFQALNLYELDSNDFPIQPSSSYEQSNSQIGDYLKSFSTQGSLERSLVSQNNNIHGVDQPNAFFVIDPGRKLNILDSETEHVFTINNANSQKTSESKSQHLTAIGKDLMNFKKNPSFVYTNVNLQTGNHAEPMGGILLSDNYFNGFPSSQASTNVARITLSNESNLKANATFSQNVPTIQAPQLTVNAIPTSQPTQATKANGQTTTYTRGRRKSKKGPCICPECRKEFANQGTLTKHMITHSDERKFVCAQCSKAFKRQDHLNGHMLTHREHKPYACDIEGCDKSYCDARSLRRHKEKHRENSIQCAEGLYLSQKPAGLNVTDKGIANSIYLPINASAQLQYFALQQQKTQNVSTNNETIETSVFAKTLVEDKATLFATKEQNIVKHSDHELTKKIIDPPNRQDNLASENALLHKLLTNQDKNVFKSQLTNGSKNQNGPTIIKLNVNNVNSANNLTVNCIQIVSQDKSEEKFHGQSEPVPINPTISKMNNLDIVSKAPDDGNQGNDLIDCSLCPKKFKTLTSLNGHMRLHGGYFKMTHLMDSKTDSQIELEKSNSQEKMNALDLNKVDNPSGTYSHQYSEKNFDLILKQNYNYDVEHVKQFNDLQLFAKDNEIDYQNVDRQIIQNDFKVPINYASTNIEKIELPSTNSMFVDPIFNNKVTPSDELNQIDQMLQQSHYNEAIVNSNEPPKELNEVMFSPITPVTPLKDNSQFTFEFSNANKSNIKHSMTYTTTMTSDDCVVNDFCYEASKNPSFLEKNDIEMQRIDINHSQEDFNELDDVHLKDFAHEESLDKNIETIDTNHNELFDQNKSDSFHNFDLPSCKLTSDLYNRRLRRNMDDSNKTRELLSIKQIAESLQSFSQSYEQRNYQNSMSSQHLNHSYSVPTTPCMISCQLANPNETYHSNNLSHHSLPATPVDSASHFTFKLSNGTHQTSLPNTPIESQQQFHFAIPEENQTTNDILNSRNFDLSCLNDAQYEDFVYASKELDSSYMDNETFKQSNIINYENVHCDRENAVTNSVGDNVDDSLNFANNENIFSQTETFNYDNNFDQSLKTKLTTILSTIQESEKEYFPLSPNKKDKANYLIEQSLNEFDFNNLNTTEKITQHVPTDINSNYIPNNDQNENRSLNEENEIQMKPVKKQLPPTNSSKISNKKQPLQCTNSIPVTIKKKKPRPEPLYIPPHVSTFVYHSRLRSPRFWNTSAAETKRISPPPYTPPPMLSPVRSGSGLFWKITNNTLVASKCFSNYTPNKLLNKKPINDFKDPKERELMTPTTAYEPYEYDIPQTDIQPHVNIGPSFQARIPTFICNRKEAKLKADKDELLWSPSVLDQSSEEMLDLYFKVSCSMCVPGQGNNKEYALHLLYYCNGDVFQALSKLVNSNPVIENQHPLSDYYYADNRSWTEDEIVLFQKSILKHDKDFYLISQEIKTKTVKECVEFYFIWKKSCPEIIRRLRFLRRKREQDALFYDIQTAESSKKLEKCNERENKSKESNHSSNGTLDNNMADMKLEKNSPNNPNPVQIKRSRTNAPPYPCVKCGKKFKKLKSRSAHMKIHGNH